MKRRTFLIGSMSGISLLAVSACTPEVPHPEPTIPTVPSITPQPVAYQRTNWTNDPFAFGAFSYLAVGSSPDDRLALRQSVDDRLFFAGEATSDANPGTVYGARASGVRAAIEVGNAATPGERITVIGAGIAGATAARLLSENGFHVVVVEGRERAGGRIQSLANDDWPFPLELGAGRVDTINTIIRAELERLGIDTEVIPDVVQVRGASGTVLDPSMIGRDAVSAAIAWASTQPVDMPIIKALHDSGAGDVDATAVDGVSEVERLDHYLQADIATIRATDPDDLSAWYSDVPVEGADVGELLVVGGYQRLVADAIANLDVLPSSPVIAVTTTESGVSLRLTKGESLSADRVVITVPLGVLKSGSIEFDPPLPFSHRSAINALGVGRQDKVVLRFDAPFWSTSAVRWDIIGADSDFPLWYNLEPVTGEPILIGLIGGEAAERLATESDAALLKSALASLQPFIDPEWVSPGE